MSRRLQNDAYTDLLYSRSYRGVRPMVKCPKCASSDVDHSTTGLPDAMQCLDCGYLFPQVMGLMSWPFPTALRPQKHGLPKYNPNNEPEAPF